MGFMDFFKKRRIQKNVDALESQEDSLRDARVDNRIKLSRARNRLLDAREARRKPAPADVLEYKSRKQAESVVENYYAAVRNAREKLEERLENIEEGREFLNEGVIPDMSAVIPTLRDVAKYDRTIVRTVARANRELAKLLFRQKEDLDRADEYMKVYEQEMARDYEEIEKEFEEEELEDLYREIDADLTMDPDDQWEKVPDRETKQKQADKDFGFQ